MSTDEGETESLLLARPKATDHPSRQENLSGTELIFKPIQKTAPKATAVPEPICNAKHP